MWPLWGGLSTIDEKYRSDTVKPKHKYYIWAILSFSTHLASWYFEN